MKLLRGILLRPTLNLLGWILRSKDGNSLIGGGPMGWSWYSTLAAMATDHHGDMSAAGGTHHIHGQLGGVGIDDHHARDHVARHHSGGADALALGSIAGNLSDAQHGSRTVANAHAHAHLSGIGANDHHNRDHASTHLVGGADALPVGTPSSIGASNSEGSATNFARRDHLHAHGTTVRCSGDFSAIDMRIRCRTADPAGPADGEIWLRTDL